MPLRPYITQPLIPQNYYHIYNRGNEQGTLIAYEKRNFIFFVRRWREYMLPYVDTLAYCILPDHYHIAVRVKPATEVLEAASRHLKVVRKDEWERLQRMLRHSKLAVLPENQEESNNIFFNPDDNKIKLPVLPDSPSISSLLPILPPPILNHLASWAVSERIRRFNLSYSKAINKQQSRRGSLMQKPFRRKLFVGEDNIKRLIRYIHRNPVKHGYATDIQAYDWSSYNVYIQNKKSFVKKETVLGMFKDTTTFALYHFDRNSVIDNDFQEP